MQIHKGSGIHSGFRFELGYVSPRDLADDNLRARDPSLIDQLALVDLLPRVLGLSAERFVSSEAERCLWYQLSARMRDADVERIAALLSPRNGDHDFGLSHDGKMWLNWFEFKLIMNVARALI